LESVEVEGFLLMLVTEKQVFSTSDIPACKAIDSTQSLK
jgi:hypothetical protein